MERHPGIVEFPRDPVWAISTIDPALEFLHGGASEMATVMHSTTHVPPLGSPISLEGGTPCSLALAEQVCGTLGGAGLDASIDVNLRQGHRVVWDGCALCR
jgi:hypothetical protein